MCCDLLLGCDFQSRNQQVTFKYDGTEVNLVSKNFNEDFCSTTISNIEPVALFTNLLSGYKPIATKSRRHNSWDQEFIDAEIQRLVKSGIIRPSNSPWRAQILVIRNKESQKRRLCIDYSQTINIYTLLDAYPLPKIETLVQQLSKYKLFSTFDLKAAYHQIPIRECDKPFTVFEGAGKLWEFNCVPFGVTNRVPVFQRVMDDLVEKYSLCDTFPYLDNVTIGGRTKEEHDKNVEQFLKALQELNLELNKTKSIFSVDEINILGYRIGNGNIKPDPDRLRPLIELPIPHNAKSFKRALGLFSYYARWIANFSKKIESLNKAKRFPLSEEAVDDFQAIKNEIASASLSSIDEHLPFIVECDASDTTVSATLNQGGRPVAFMSRTLQPHECHYPAVEKEATSIIEAVRKWRHFLARQHFNLVTDQQSVAFMLDSRKRTKVKNNKIQSWRLELASLSYTIQYRPGKEPFVLLSFLLTCIIYIIIYATLALLDCYTMCVQKTCRFL